jgi:hypothetical protein
MRLQHRSALSSLRSFRSGGGRDPMQRHLGRRPTRGSLRLATKETLEPLTAVVPTPRDYGCGQHLRPQNKYKQAVHSLDLDVPLQQ